MKLDYEILSLFKGTPEREFSTSEIIEKLYPDEYQNLNSKLESADISNDAKKELRNDLSMLHRRVLYHISSLVKKELLVVTKVEDKGRKFFALAIQEGEELVIDSFKRKIVITRSSSPVLPLGDIEEKKLAFRVEPSSFFDKVNALLIECDKFQELDPLYDLIYELFSEVNDVIGLNNFELILQNFESTKILQFFAKLGEECESYDRRISCIIDFTKVTNNEKIGDFFKKNLANLNERILFVFDVTSREVIAKSDLLELIIDCYSLNKRKLNIKNDDLNKPPYIIGKAGPYCFAQKEWQKYQQKHQSTSIGLICAQSSIVSDISEFYAQNPSAKDFKEHVLKLAKALFISNAHQRKSTFKTFKKLGKHLESWQTFEYSKNYIRFWNFEFGKTEEEALFFLETLDEIKREVDLFSKNQETIYLSCGMPTAFKIGFSMAYKNFDKDIPLEEQFQPINISTTKDLYSPAMKERLRILEKAAQLFDGGSEVKFIHIGNERSVDVLREINTILNSHNAPFFCCSFKNPTGINMNLTNFFN